MQYDAEERLASWQNAPTSPTMAASYLYDGAGERVAQQVTSGGTTTTTAYLGGNEEVATSGGGTTTTYYAVAGRLIALAVNGSFSYLADDGLGSVNVAFDANGNPQASVLYRPYGTPRYTSGSMPGSFGFTGQRNDTAVTGLDYYGARYYDPAAGSFASADNLLLDAKAVSAGQARMLLNRYAYVEGNPESRTDPSGHRLCDTKDGSCGQSHGDPCRGQVQQCEAIYAAFSDHAIRRFLLLLARTEIGAKFLTFILFMADKVGGDRFIQWGHLGNSGPPTPAVSNSEGYITLNLDFIPGSSRIPDQVFASAIMHETVEVYYDVVLGIRDMAKLHADYVADFFAGMFELQLDGYPAGQGQAGSYGYNYADWVTYLKNQPTHPYANEMGPGQQDVNLHPDNPGTAYFDVPWWEQWVVIVGMPTTVPIDVKGAPNLGLDTGMLTTDDLTPLALIRT